MGPVVGVDSPIDTITLPTTPLCATPTWLAAVEAAGGLCQCTGCAKTHKPTAGRCGQRQGLNGARLHLTGGGAVYCAACFAWQQNNTRANTSPPATAQGDLFDLLTGA
jgi:hypothetical protein